MNFPLHIKRLKGISNDDFEKEAALYIVATTTYRLEFLVRHTVEGEGNLIGSCTLIFLIFSQFNTTLKSNIFIVVA